MQKIKLLLSVSIILIFIVSCKKETGLNITTEKTESVSLPKLVRNDAAPNGVLSFENKKSLEIFLKELEYNKAPEDGKLPTGFKSLHNYLQAYRDKLAMQSTLSNKPQTNYQSLTVNDISNESTQEEYLYNLDSYLVPDDRFSYVLNDNLQIMVDGEFYQITRLGILVVEAQNLAGYAQWYPTQENDVLYNPTVTSFPNEVPLGNNAYQVSEGITRMEFASPSDDFYTVFSPPSTPIATGTSTSSEIMDTYTVGTDFKRTENIRKGDRRFIFESYNTDFLWLGVFKSIGVKGKVQRERKFLWFTYWGESFADEIIVGCENMSLRLDYTFPIPQQYTLLDRPKFNGIVPSYQVGNFAFDVVDLDVNLSTNFFGRTYNLTSNNFINLINSQFNSFVGNQFNSSFTNIQDDIINSFDPSFKPRYAAYTKKINSITESNKFRIELGYTAKTQGYSHTNNWQMDANGGFKAKIGLGPNSSGTSVSGDAYGYTMKAGSFYGKARIGSDWYKIRFVVQ